MTCGTFDNLKSAKSVALSLVSNEGRSDSHWLAGITDPEA